MLWAKSLVRIGVGSFFLVTLLWFSRAQAAPTGDSTWIFPALHEFETDYDLTCSLLSQGQDCSDRRNHSIGMFGPQDMSNPHTGDHCTRYEVRTCKPAHTVPNYSGEEPKAQIEISFTWMKTRLDAGYILNQIEFKGLSTLLPKSEDNQELDAPIGSNWIGAWLNYQGNLSTPTNENHIQNMTTANWKRGLRFMGEHPCKRNHYFDFKAVSLIAGERKKCATQEEMKAPNYSSRNGEPFGFIESLSFQYSQN